MSHDAAERLVAGRWTLHTALRRGPAGMIWRATDAADGRRLAVEELRLAARPDPAGADQAALWDRVAAEARAAASLDHPGLARLDDVVVTDGVVYVATQLVEGVTLDELVARDGPLPVGRVARMGLDLLDALEATHGAGLAHLDLRPANVLIPADGRTRLAGVGLAALRNAPGADRGTTAFLAPEQVRGDPAGPPADLWSLGAVLFLAVEGETPFTAEGTEAVLAGMEAAGDRREGSLAGREATLAAILTERPRLRELAGPLAPTLAALLTKPAGGRPSIAETRRLLEPLAEGPHRAAGSPASVAGSPAPARSPASADTPPRGQSLLPGARNPHHPVQGPPEGEPSASPDGTPPVVHSPPPDGPPAVHLDLPPQLAPAAHPGLPQHLAPPGLQRPPYGPRAGWYALDPVVRQVLLIAGGSVVLALVSFLVAVAVTGDPLGLRGRAVASTVTVPPSTSPTTAAPTSTIPPTTLAALVPPGWAVHTDPATGYQVAVPPGWQVVADGGPRTELRDQSSPTFLRIDWQQDPQADPVSLEQQASQAHAGEHGDYRQARLEPTQFKGLPAALLEFTYQDGETWHALELGVRSPRHHVAMAIYSRDRDWGAGWALFEAFKASFVPPSA
jgi:eukaryotic-like serine/threonine-protein kinase